MKKIVCIVSLLLISSLAWAEDDRHSSVDRAIGGMQEGSRIQSPGRVPMTDVHKTISSSQGTKKAGSSTTTSVVENHGVIYSNPEQTNNTGTTGGSETGTSVSKNHSTGENQPGTDQLPTEETNHPIDTGGTQPEDASTGGGVTQPTEGSHNPIVETDVNVNPESGTVEADATVDTTGELEDKQIFDADLDAQEVATVDSEVGSASDITGHETVEGADLTTSGQASGSTQVTTDQTTHETSNLPATESGSGTQQPSEPPNNPIVDADVHVNPESGTVETEATVDTSGELEERQIIDADVGAGDVIATEAEVESAADITQSETVKSADITTEPVLSTTPTSTVTAEVDTTGEIGGSEAEAGIEADVSGLSEGEDVTCDPSDGLLSSAACADLRL